jgi:broad specificity phosphatase PhoE
MFKHNITSVRTPGATNGYLKESKKKECLVRFIRHGKSRAHDGEANRRAKLVALSSIGKAQAKDIASYLERKPDLIVSSPYLRAWQTALPTKERFPDVNCRVWSDVQEFSYLEAIDGVLSTQADRSPFVKEYWNICRPDWNFEGDKENESFKQLVQRAQNTLNRLQKYWENKQQCDTFIVIFTHEQFIRAIEGLINGTLKIEPDARDMKFFRQKLINTPLAFASGLEVKKNSLKADKWTCKEWMPEGEAKTVSINLFMNEIFVPIETTYSLMECHVHDKQAKVSLYS